MAKLKSPKTYLLFDSANTFFRARHVVRGDDIDTKTGLALHICINSVKKCWERFKADHVVFCFEGRSWRKDTYTPYKDAYHTYTHKHTCIHTYIHTYTHTYIHTYI